MMKLLRTTALFAAILAAGHYLPPPLRGIVVMAFSLAAFCHFAGRILRNRLRGRPRASAVSLALAFLSLGPLVVFGVVRGFIPPRLYSLVELAAFVISIGLAVAILRVEYLEDARKAQRRSLLDDGAMLERIRREAAQKVRDVPTVRPGRSRP